MFVCFPQFIGKDRLLISSCTCIHLPNNISTDSWISILNEHHATSVFLSNFILSVMPNKAAVQSYEAEAIVGSKHFI